MREKYQALETIERYHEFPRNKLPYNHNQKFVNQVLPKSINRILLSYKYEERTHLRESNSKMSSQITVCARGNLSGLC